MGKRSMFVGLDVHKDSIDVCIGEMLARQAHLPKTVRDIAWKAQLRLTGRFRRLVGWGKRNLRWRQR